MAPSSLATDKGYWEYPLLSVIMLVAFVFCLWMYRKKHIPLEKLGTNTSSTFCLPCHFQVPQSLLFGYRLAIAPAFLVVAILASIRYGWNSFRFYTTWNFWAQFVYFGLILYYSCIRSTSVKHARTMQIYLTLLLVNAWIVTVVFWTLLAPATPNFIDIAQHGLNHVALVVEFGLNSFVIKKHYGYLVPVPSIVFAVTTWIIHAANSDLAWPYGFMEVARPESPLWYGGILFAHVIFFFLVYGMSKLKEIVLIRDAPDLELYHGNSWVVNA